MKKRYFIKNLTTIFILILLISNCATVSLLSKKEKITTAQQKELQNLIRDLKGNKSTRDQAREAIINIGKPAIPLLTEVLRRDSDFTLSWEAVNIMGYMGDKEAAPILIDQVLKAENNHVRWRSIWALSQIEDEKKVPHLLKAMEEGDERIRWNAAVALSNMDCKDAVPVLEEGLKSHSDWIQWEAVNALGRVHDENTVTELIPLLTGSNKRLRQEIILSLGKIRDKRATDALIEMLADNSPDLRWRAAMAIGMIGDKKAVPILEKHLKEEEDIHVREYIKRTLKKFAP